MARNNERSNIVIIAEVMEAGVENQRLKGKSFSITGHLSQSRNRIIDLIRNAGGVFDTIPNYSTTYLITNADWSAQTVTSGKSRKFLIAQRNGTKIISEAQFLEMLV